MRRPPGFSTRDSSRSAAAGSRTVHSTSVATAVSNESSSNGRSSAPAFTIVTGRSVPSALRRSRLAIGSSGSVQTSFSIVRG